MNDLATLLSSSTLADLTWPKGPVRAKLAADPKAPEGLRALCLDAQQGQDVRFKACETFLVLGGQPAGGEAATIAEVYAAEIKDGRTHTIWGLPDAVGASQVSRRLIGLGKAAVPALKPLLKEARALFYQGSEEPTTSKKRKYQVSDLAAALIAAITGGTFPAASPDPAVRQQAADALHGQI